MRRYGAWALGIVLSAAGPGIALGPELDSDSQMKGYGSLFGWVCGSAAGLAVLLLGFHIIKGIRAEHERGKKRYQLREEILDELPKKKKPEELYLGEKVPPWKIDKRVRATRALLKFLARRDAMYSKKKIMTAAERAIRLIKAAIELRTTRTIEKFVSRSCLERLRNEIIQLRSEGELRIFGTLEIVGIDVVQVNAPREPNQQSFTVLITFRSKDYIKDDRTGERLRGDKNTYTVQEFIRFQRVNDRWIIDQVRESGDMDRVLGAKNFLEPRDLDRFAKTVDDEFLREFVTPSAQ